MEHWLGRPPTEALNVHRLTLDGAWVPDDGQPGIAFSGHTPVDGYPHLTHASAWVSHHGKCDLEKCPCYKAANYTLHRYQAVTCHLMEKKICSRKKKVIEAATSLRTARNDFRTTLLGWRDAHESGDSAQMGEMEDRVASQSIALARDETQLIVLIRQAARYEAENTKAEPRKAEEPKINTAGGIDFHTEVPLSELKLPDTVLSGVRSFGKLSKGLFGSEPKVKQRLRSLGKKTRKFAIELLKFKLRDGEVFTTSRVVDIHKPPNNTNYMARNMLQVLTKRGLVKKVGKGTWSIPDRSLLREALTW